jgi:hypothetical protein
MHVTEKEMNMNIQMEVPAATLSDHAGSSKTGQYEQRKNNTYKLPDKLPG